jgi:glycosyltransferase involved in cell wall biosynthesis
MIIADFESTDMTQRAIDSVADVVDGMYITVTYKKDKPTVNHPILKLLKKYKANVSLYKWTYNFSNARNFAMEKVPTGPNMFIIWIDSDDIFVGADNLRGITEEMYQNNNSGVYFDYWYNVELDKDGNVKEIIVKHKRERIIVNNYVWHWVGALHETLIELQQENLVRYFRPECHVVHLSPSNLSEEKLVRNIEILEATAKEEKHRDPRTLIYLAKAYLDKVKMSPEKDKKYLIPALTLLHEYLEGSGEVGSPGYIDPSGWSEERSTAWESIAEIAIIQGNIKVAIGAFENAIDEAPEFPNYYAGLAMCYVILEDFKKARHWINVCTAIPEPNTTIILCPRDLKVKVLSVSYEVNLHDQKLEWALKDAEKLYKIIPDDFNKERLENIKQIVRYNKVCQSYVYISKYLEDIKEKDKIVNLINSMSTEIQSENFVSQMKHLFLPSRKWDSNEIAILCGPGAEKWDPDSAKTGIGGSEEAVINMSNELTKLGWKITVFNAPNKIGDFDGVEYKNWRDINPKDEFNVLILWRNIGFVDINPKAKFIMLWAHDVPNNPDLTEKRIDKIDKIAVLSEYHKTLFRMNKKGTFVKIPDNKFFVTSNGVLKEDTPKWNGNPHRLIYMSSPDRGLVTLLGMWAEIKKSVPDAELHVFYGWNVYDTFSDGNPAKLKWKEGVLKMMEQPGIFDHGRVGHAELHKEIGKSGIWAYPTVFSEISCISGMKSQKYGAIPVVSDFAALTETVKNGLKIDMDMDTDEGKKEFVKSLIGLLKDTKKQSEIRKGMMEFAKDYYNWDNVASYWSELFNLKVQNLREK